MVNAPIQLVRSWSKDHDDGDYTGSSIYLVDKDTEPYHNLVNVILEKARDDVSVPTRSALDRCTYLAIMLSTTFTSRDGAPIVSHFDRAYIVNEKMENILVLNVGEARHNDVVVELFKHDIVDTRKEFADRYLKDKENA